MNMAISGTHATTQIERLVTEQTASDGSLQWYTASGTAVIRAASCLLRPRCGDTVLIVLSESRGYICSVLEQSDAQHCVYEFQGDLDSTLVAKKLKVIGKFGINLTSFGDLNLLAPVGGLHVSGKDLFLSAVDTYVNIASNMITKVTDYIHKSRGASLFTARHHMVTATEVVKIDAKRIDMG
jgi:hypothetical protein